MVGNAKIVDVNIDPSQKEPDGFSRFVFSDKSMDGYIECKSGAKIQFRAFAGAKLTGWQGEVSGKSAKHGKISLGPLNLLIKNHVGGTKMVSTGAARLVASNRAQVEKDIFCGFHRYNPGANDKKVCLDLKLNRRNVRSHIIKISSIMRVRWIKRISIMELKSGSVISQKLNVKTIQMLWT